ncbi:MAG: hypothetical protein HW390_1101 [Candidatus Brocadiaceae bacterium]|nr:hypothetical protein [Candidatus Brocadiaceae bacterium]
MDTQELGLLMNALKNKDTGFYLVEASDNAVIDDLLLKINVAMGQVGKKTAAIDFSGKSDCWFAADLICNKVKASPDIHIFFIRNLETPAGANPANFLRQLNMSRETIYALGRNMVFIVSPAFARLFMLHAKDLFSWIPQRFTFEGGAVVTPREFAQSMRMDERVRFRGDKDRAYLKELIALYEEQLRHAPDNAQFRVENIIKPLAGLYKENDDFGKEVLLRGEIKDFYKVPDERYAAALTSLGNVYGRLPTGDRAENLQKAIDAYREALKIRTIEAFPVGYARIMNNLGVAYQGLPAGDRAENLKKAIDAYQEALKIFTIEAFPVDYAMTMNNLGNTYQDLPTGDRAENLNKAIDAYREALKIYTIEAFPRDHAMVKSNLDGLLDKA